MRQESRERKVPPISDFFLERFALGELPDAEMRSLEEIAAPLSSEPAE